MTDARTSRPAALLSRFGADRVRAGVGLAPFTTFKVGGPAEWLFEPRSAEEVVEALRLAAHDAVRVSILGGGSNVLVGDLGGRGLVIRPRGRHIERAAADLVRAEAGVTVNGLVRWTITHGLAGLERWAGTPGTIGGGVVGNAHFDGCLLGDLVDVVRVVTLNGAISDLRQAELEFGYDRSRLQRTREVLLWAEFRVAPGDADLLRERARASLRYRKHTQPLDTPSAGCIFQNPDPAAVSLPAGVPAAAGALVDRAGLKGRRIGRAVVSRTHANFILNEGGATARDIRQLIAACQRAVRARFGVELREEIVYLGEFGEQDEGPCPLY